MENLSKKVGYLKGLMEGADLESGSPNGKLLAGIVDLLGDLCDRMEVIDELLDDLNDYVESIDDDLAELESEHDDGTDFFDDDNDDDDEDFDDAFGDGEDKLHLLRTGETDKSTDDAVDDEPDALAGKLCPLCGHMFFTAIEDDENAQYACPHCGERVTPMPLTPENAPIAKPVEE